MKLNAKIALAAVGCCGVVTAMACFPDVTFSNGAGAGGAGAVSSSSSAASTGTGGHAATSSSSSSASSSSSSSSGAPDGGTPCKGPDPCDCDGDGDRADTAECNHDGGDCNNHDPDVNSKQTKWFTAQGSNGWDYNCNGQADLQLSPVLTCPNGLACDATTTAWHGAAPACGAMGNIGTCNKPMILQQCAEVITAQKQQGCH